MFKRENEKKEGIVGVYKLFISVYRLKINLFVDCLVSA